MKSVITIVVVLAFASIGAKAQYNKENLKLESAATLTKFKCEKLQLFPVRANQAFRSANRDVGNYTTLKQALEQKKIVVSEQVADGEGSAQVNSLFLENTSNDTIMILAGEVVTGGKQDRVIAQDIILDPHSGKHDVSVFCVEPYRWEVHAGSDAYDAYDFDGYMNVGSVSIRRTAVKEKDQQKVWDEVGKVTQDNKAETSSGTYAALQNSKEFQENLQRYITFYKTKFDNDPDVIGVVAVTGDTVLGCDLFATNQLFRQSFENILYSYATEAITYGKEVTISYDKVNEYIDRLLANEDKQEEVIGNNGTELKKNAVRLHITTF
jgi:hypothetical protein